MKKILLVIVGVIVNLTTASAFTIDEMCGTYLETTSGKQKRILSDDYDDISFTNLVIVSKKDDSTLLFYGYFTEPSTIEGTFDEASQTITFSSQTIWDTESYILCKDKDITATIDESGNITFNNYKIYYGSEVKYRSMKTSFTKQAENYISEGTISAPGYFEGSATLKAYKDGRYLLTEGTTMGYTHYVLVDQTTSRLSFPWGQLVYSDDPLCYIYNVLEDEDVIMLSNNTEESSCTDEDGIITFISPFKYYQDYSDMYEDKDPDAEGTYTATFDSSSAGIADVTTNASHLTPSTYNLNGQKLTTVKQGINIIGNRKVIVR